GLVVRQTYPDTDVPFFVDDLEFLGANNSLLHGSAAPREREGRARILARRASRNKQRVAKKGGWEATDARNRQNPRAPAVSQAARYSRRDAGVNATLDLVTRSF